MDTKLARVYYIAMGYWKDFAAIKKLAKAAKVPLVTTKQWLIKQAIWQIYLPPPRYIPRLNIRRIGTYLGPPSGPSFSAT